MYVFSGNLAVLRKKGETVRDSDMWGKLDKVRYTEITESF